MVLVVQGLAFTEASIARIEARMRERPFTATALSAVAEDVCEAEFGSRDAGMRLADRLIQKHRKAGNLTKSTVGRPVWTWTGSAA